MTCNVIGRFVLGALVTCLLCCQEGAAWRAFVLPGVPACYVSESQYEHVENVLFKICYHGGGLSM